MLADPIALGKFREVQQLAYAAAESVGQSLEPGVTEKQAVQRIRDYLLLRGVQDWFHTPFAWFGDRTAFRNFWTPLKFFPTHRRLEEGMPFILDCAGYDNRHRVYPGRVIAHQISMVHSRLPRFIAAGFGIRALQTLVGDLIVERMHHRSPLWADGEISNHPATPGLWAVEPHIGFHDVGVKFEEILVVPPSGNAYWLDDDLPHVRRWQPTAAAS
ncbi:MAG: M24 family metallopeptidase [Pseudonocardia sp.]|nr:M24 family metallopeptidase [Pseudonocardia sp.]